VQFLANLHGVFWPEIIGQTRIFDYYIVLSAADAINAFFASILRTFKSKYDMYEINLSILALAKEMNLLFIMGVALAAGTAGAKIFRRFHIPEVVGLVAIGAILGPILKIIPQQTVAQLELFNIFILGMIGFLVGGELKREVFRRFGRQVPIVLLFEGVTAFVIVIILTFSAMFALTRDWRMSTAVSVVFGAICSATDPASTIAVLWEYKARGPLTSMLAAIVTLDDALALILYAISFSVVDLVTGRHSGSFFEVAGGIFYEIAGSITFGIVIAFILERVLRIIGDREKVLIITLAAVVLSIGAAIFLGLDSILVAMALGTALVNLKSRVIPLAFELTHKFFSPFYILFFVLVGARVVFENIDRLVFALIIAYVIGSISGKTLGAYLGGIFANAVPTLKKYLGFCLYPQGGIAVGLLIVSSHRFDPNIASMMLLVVVIGAFILQIIGPIGVKYGAGKAGELGLNITEEDLIASYKVSDVMDYGIPVISYGTSLTEIIETVGKSTSFYFPCVDTNGKLIGAITLDGIRTTFADRELHDWLVALDVLEPAEEKLTPDIPLSQALEAMKRCNAEYLPIVDSIIDDKLIGIIDSRSVHRKLTAFVLEKQKIADSKFSHPA